jgi:hypothetical protein
LARRGLVNRLFGGRLRRLMTRSWQMYPLGLLFGLGFDTASEVGLLAMTAGASAGDSADSRGVSAADPVRRRHDIHGHDRRRADVQSLRLGAVEPGPEDFLQRGHHGTVGGVCAGHRLRRAPAGAGQGAQPARRPGTTPSSSSTSARWATSSSDLFLLAWGGSVAVWKLGLTGTVLECPVTSVSAPPSCSAAYPAMSASIEVRRGSDRRVELPGQKARQAGQYDRLGGEHAILAHPPRQDGRP